VSVEAVSILDDFKELIVRFIPLATLGLISIGCASAPSAPRVMVPPVDPNDGTTVRGPAPDRPMPRDVYETQLPPPPFEDAPMLNQPTPEQSAFVDTYNRVGRPRISVIVDSANDQRKQSFDDEAFRNVLTDWMACNGQVTMVASSTPKEADQNADVLVKIQSHPTQQYEDGTRVRLLAEAFNTKDHVSIGRAFVDVPPPLEKTQINRYTRWLARKLMDDMTASWLQPEPGNVKESAAPATTAPEK